MGKDNNLSQFKGSKNPVEHVSWEDCQIFLKRLTEKAGGGGSYCLPTEAQWEYACRAGSTGGYCFGSSELALDDYAWDEKNSDEKTHPVGQKTPNAWGFYDIHGNVWQWCQDWYGHEYYATSPAEDPPGPLAGTHRVTRGGSWDGPQCNCRSSYRGNGSPGGRQSNVGFRVCMVLPDK